MVVFRFADYGPILVTRNLGARVRESLLLTLSGTDKVVLDFDGVEMVGNSFADECLGKLLMTMSLDELRQHTTFHALSGLSKVSVSAALRRRYNSLVGTSDPNAYPA